MAIVKMSDFQLMILNEHLDDFLIKSQSFNKLSFRKVEKKDSKLLQPVSPNYDFERNQFLQERLKEVLSSVSVFEKKHKKKKKPLENLNVTEISFDELVRRCEHIDIEKVLNDYDRYYDVATGVIENFQVYRPWEAHKISKENIEQLSTEKPIVGTVDNKQMKQMLAELKKEGHVLMLWKENGSQRQACIIIPTDASKAKTEIILDKYHFEKRSAGSLGIGRELKVLNQQIGELSNKYQSIDDRIARIGNYREELELYYEYLQNEELRYKTKAYFLASKDVTLIEGWVFTEHVAAFKRMVEDVSENCFILEVNPADLESKDVPIKLTNKGIFSAFEGITNMYSLPRYNELDPTALFTPFYAAFFGMMLGDVGYGVILLAATFLVTKLVNLKASTMNFVRFLFFLSFPTIIFGWIYGSCFGGMVPINGLIDINKDFMKVMIFALIFGIVHLFFGLGIKAYMYIRKGDWLGALCDVGFWYVTLIGAIVLVSTMFTPLLSAYSGIAWPVMIVGMVGIVLTNGRHSKSVVGKVGNGLYSLYGLTDYVGDVLSYSRLMALGLAGASIGLAFNMIVEMLSSLGFIGVIAGFCVFVFGHVFNMGISGLSAYVHSARLTYVEFFGKFYTGGGKKFEGFRSKSKYINILQEDE